MPLALAAVSDSSVPDDVVAELKSKHGEVYLLEHLGEAVVVMRPTRPLVKRFRSQMADQNKRADALEYLVTDCIVWPDRKAVQAMLDRLPGLVETFGDAVLDLTGVDKNIEKKVL